MYYYGLIILLLSAISVLSSKSLYSVEDPLIELNSSNFGSIVYEKNSAWIIQFYNSWCGHCIRFAPLWKQFARDTKMWHKVIQVGVVNCNDAENVKLCRHYDVNAFPTIKLFWHNIDDSEMGEQLERDGSIVSIENSTIRFLESNWLKGVPSSWPDLTSLQLTSVNEILKSIHINNEGLYLFIEDDESLVGRQIILDLSFQSSVIIRRVLNTNSELLDDLEPGLFDGSIPILLKIDQSGKGEVPLRFPINATFFGIRDEVFKLIVGHPRNTDVENDSKEVKNSTNSLLDSVYMIDLENAVYYSLSQEVGVTKNIDGDEFSALKSYLLILKTYFPGTPPIMAYLSKLYNQVSYRKRSLTGAEFVQTMEQLQSDEAYLPKVREWQGCKGSQEKYRGYPCSLWTLFHTLTVQADNEFKESHGHSETAEKAIFVVRDYVKYFFTCHECVKNFCQMAANLEKDVNSSQNAVLWLWEAHNKVNRRLAGDETEDPKHKKIQFPSSILCPKCRISGNTFSDTVWNRDNVMRFLRQFYGKQNFIKKEEDFPSSDQMLNDSRELKSTLNPVLVALLISLFYMNFRPI